MLIDRIPVGTTSFEVNVIIEVPVGSEPVKYRVGQGFRRALRRSSCTPPMQYPCNYGFVPHTLSDDGDPVDAGPWPPCDRAGRGGQGTAGWGAGDGR